MTEINKNKIPLIFSGKLSDVSGKTTRKDQHLLFISKTYTSSFKSTLLFSYGWTSTHTYALIEEGRQIPWDTKKTMGPKPPLYTTHI